MTWTVDTLAKKVVLWCGAFAALAAVLGWLNAVAITGPITRAMKEERESREAGDKAIIDKLANITVGQDKVIEAVETATYSKPYIDKLKRDADAVHLELRLEQARLEGRFDRNDFRLERIEGRLKMPTIMGSRPAPAWRDSGRNR